MVATGVRDQRVPWVPRVLVMVPRLTRGYPCTRVTRGITREWRVPMPEYPLGTGDGLRKNDGDPYPWVFTRVAPYLLTVGRFCSSSLYLNSYLEQSVTVSRSRSSRM